MRRRWIPVLLALGVCAAAPVEEDEPAALLERLSQKESQLADLYADFWRAQYRVALGDADASTAASSTCASGAWGPEAGAYLRAKFFRRGESLTLDEILAVIYRGSSFSTFPRRDSWRAASTGEL